MVHPHGARGDENEFLYYDHTINKTFKFNPITLEGEITAGDGSEGTEATNDLRD